MKYKTALEKYWKTRFRFCWDFAILFDCVIYFQTVNATRHELDNQCYSQLVRCLVPPCLRCLLMPGVQINISPNNAWVMIQPLHLKNLQVWKVSRHWLPCDVFPLPVKHIGPHCPCSEPLQDDSRLLLKRPLRIHIETKLLLATSDFVLAMERATALPRVRSNFVPHI